MLKIYCFLLTLLASTSLNGQELDANTMEALSQTQQLLRSRALREQAAKESGSAQAAHNHAAALSGNQQNLDALYDTSAEVMEWLTQQTQGDAQKMQALMLKAKENPEAFYQSLPEKIKSKIRSMAGQFPAPKTSPR